jgi:hypothetical protein
MLDFGLGFDFAFSKKGLVSLKLNLMSIYLLSKKNISELFPAFL